MSDSVRCARPRSNAPRTAGEGSATLIITQSNCWEPYLSYLRHLSPLCPVDIYAACAFQRFRRRGGHRSGSSRGAGRICVDSHLVEPVPGCPEIGHHTVESERLLQVRGIHGRRGEGRTALSRRDLERGGTPEHDVTHTQEAPPPGSHGRRHGSRDGFAAGCCLCAGGPLRAENRRHDRRSRGAQSQCP